MELLDGDLTTFADDAMRWLDEHVPARWKLRRNALSEEEMVEIRQEWDRDLFRGGYAGISLPKEFGGQGLSLREEVMFYELAARAHAPESMGRAGKLLAIPTLIAAGTKQQQERYIPPILKGEEVWCQGFSEPGAGSDLANVSTTARRVDGGYRVSGQKTWTSFAQYADRCILLARTDPTAPRHRNLSYFLLNMRQEGIAFRTIKQISGGSHFAEVFLEDAFVANEDLVGAEGDGWRIAMTTLTSERGGIEAIMRYVEMRGDLDILLRCCARTPEARAEALDLDTKLELVRWHVLKGLDYVDDEAALAPIASVLKITWSELWQAMTAFAVRIPCQDHKELWHTQYLETRGASIYSGSNEIQRNIIAERVLGLPR